MDKASTINNSMVKYQNGSSDYGVYFEGASTASVIFNYNTIANNYYGNYLTGPFVSSFRCNHINDNTSYGVFGVNGSMYFANGTGISGGNNQIYNNSMAIQVSGNGLLYLNNGYNDLRSTDYCLYGSMNTFGLTSMAANNNYWKSGGGTPVINVNYQLTGASGTITVTDNSPENQYFLCSAPGEPGPMSFSLTSNLAPMDETYDYREVSTNLGELPLNEAINTILNTDKALGDVYDLETRFALLAEVLENEFTDINPAESWYVNHAYNQFKSALGQFEKQKNADKIDEKLTQKMQKVIHKLIQEQAKADGKLSTYSPELMAYFMDEANTQWYAGNYDEAIVLLQTAAGKANAYQQCEIQKMICQIEVDREFIARNNTLEIEERLAKCSDCNESKKSGSLTLEKSDGGSMEQEKSVGLMDIKLSINAHPVNQESLITIFSPGEATLVIYNSTGQLVSKQPISAGLTNQTVSNSYYAPGVYLVTVMVDGQTMQAQKMVVTK